MTQVQLAKFTGLTQPQISLIETGRENPRLNTVELLAQGIQVPLEELFRGITSEDVSHLVKQPTSE